MSSMDSSEVPSKRARVESDCLTCIICSKNALRVELVSPKDQSSWITLLKAAQIHVFEPILQLSTSEESLPDIFYHRECGRSAFTHKKTLKSLQSKNTASTANDSLSQQQWTSLRQPNPTASRVLEKVFIFCDKSSKY